MKTYIRLDLNSLFYDSDSAQLRQMGPFTILFLQLHIHLNKSLKSSYDYHYNVNVT